MKNLNHLINLITTAHGGLEKWNSYGQIEVSLIMRGNLLAYKGISPFKRKMKVTIDTKRVKAILDPFPREGLIGVYEGDFVSIEKKESRQRVSELKNARASCKSKLIWNNLHLLYFLGYALWNYINTPYLFLWKDFKIEVLPEIKIGGKFLHNLEVVFPDVIPSHCSKQNFYFTETGLLQRLDYTAEIFGSFLTGAHICEDHKLFNGFSFPTHRIVYPRIKKTTFPFLPSAMEGWIENIEFIK
jgi:hypothetical protein